MSPRAVRRLVLVVFVAGIGGMILGSILDNNGVAITFGLTTAVAALGLILVTMVVPPDAFRKGTPRPDGSEPANVAPGGSQERSFEGQARPRDEEDAGARIEEQVELLVAAGADERDVRELVRRAVTFGRQVRS
jgi:hypothetical protein